MEWILGQFAGKKREARKGYREFVAGGMAKEEAIELEGTVTEALAGGKFRVEVDGECEIADDALTGRSITAEAP